MTQPKRSPLSGLTDMEALKLQKQGYAMIYAIDHGLIKDPMDLCKKVNTTIKPEQTTERNTYEKEEC